VSNYRVRQVLALGDMPERQLRFLIALATWMDDYSLTVRIGFDTLIKDSGNTHNTVRKARRELEADKRISSEAGNGRGHQTAWTARCLPEKGTNIAGTQSGAGKGTNRGRERVPTEAEKGYQPQRADQQEPDCGLNRLAKPSRARGREQPSAALAADADLIRMIIEEVRDATGRTISSAWAGRVKQTILNGHEPARAGAYIRQAIRAEPDPRTRFLPIGRPGYGSP